MFRTLSTGAAIAMSLAATTATAAIYDITLRGHLTSTGSGTGVGKLNATDVVTFKMRVSDKYTVAWGDTGQTVAYSRFSEVGGLGSTAGGYPEWDGPFYGLTVGGYEFYDIDPFDHYSQTKYLFDETTGEPIIDYHRFLGGPAVAFEGGRVTGVWAVRELFSSTFHSSDTTALLVTGGRAPPPTGYEVDAPQLGYDNVRVFGAIVPERFFSISEGGPLAHLLGEYPGRSFTGEWDFENSSVVISGIPEPSTWGLMILGFGALGASMRRRHAPARA